jgi:hypothetical protein
MNGVEMVNTQSNVKRVNEIDVFYSRIPIGLVEGFDGIIFYFQTTEAFDAKAHEGAVKPIIDALVDQSYDHGAYWVLTKCEAVVWHERSQVSVVSFRVRDSY